MIVIDPRQLRFIGPAQFRVIAAKTTMWPYFISPKRRILAVRSAQEEQDMTYSRRRGFLIGGAVVAIAAAGAIVVFDPFDDGFVELAAAPVFAPEGVAIRGYDPVAYFTDGHPVAGDPAIETAWKGAVWRFSSTENRDKFRSSPNAYAPAYGGFCAWAVAAKGKLYSTQPSNWTIVDGMLYLNFNDDIQARWEADIPGFIEEADRRWPGIVEGT